MILKTFFISIIFLFRFVDWIVDFILNFFLIFVVITLAEFFTFTHAKITKCFKFIILLRFI